MIRLRSISAIFENTPIILLTNKLVLTIFRYLLKIDNIFNKM